MKKNVSINTYYELTVFVTNLVMKPFTIEEEKYADLASKPNLRLIKRIDANNFVLPLKDMYASGSPT